MEPPPPSLRGLLLRTAFTLLYHQFAWAYDWVSRTFFGGQWRTWQRQALVPLRDSALWDSVPALDRRVLELGFGTGNLQLDMARAGVWAVGVDPSAAMVRQARRKARRRGVALRLLRAAAGALPFPAASFAAVVSTFPSEYIAAPRTLAEIARVLAPGGRLVVVPGAWLLPTSPTNRGLELFARLVYGTRGAPLIQRRSAGPPGRNATPEQIIARAFPTLTAGLAAHGFTVRVQAVRLPTSMVLLIIADKRATE